MNPMEDLQKGVEQLDKQIGQIAKQLGVSEKDQSMINSMVADIAKVFTQHDTSDKQLAALKELAGDPQKDAKKFVAHNIAMTQFIADKTNSHKHASDLVNQDLKVG